MAIADIVGISTGGDPITLGDLRVLVNDTTAGWKADSAVYVTAAKGDARVMIERRA